MRSEPMMDTLFYQPAMQAVAIRQPDQGLPLPSASFLAILSRIEESVDEETAGIRRDPGYDLRASNARKSRHLYELNRAMKGVDLNGLGPDHHDALARLRDRLAENETVLKAHLSAVGEVAALLQDVIERHEADGTYAPGAGQSARS